MEAEFWASEVLTAASEDWEAEVCGPRGEEAGKW